MQTTRKSKKMSSVRLTDKEEKYVRDSFYFGTSGKLANVLISVLIGVVSSIFPLLLNKDSAVFYTSLPLYFSIVILFAYVLLMKWWAILAGIVTFVILGCLQDFGFDIFVANTMSNLIQLFLLLVSIDVIKNYQTKKNNNKNNYVDGVFYLSTYNMILIATIILYVVHYSINDGAVSLNILYYIAGFLAFLTVLKSLFNKDIYIILYTLLVSFVPSLIASCFSCYWTSVPSQDKYQYVVQWTLSNYILLQTIGYILYQILYTKKIVFFRNSRYVPFTYNSAIYYFSLLLMNSLILYLTRIYMTEHNGYIFFFPWLVGNSFFGFNLVFSFMSDAVKIESEKERFDWYEKRVVVVEHNMSFIITIIAFLLPTGFSFMHQVTNMHVVIFISTIFCACITLGLIWIPSNKIKVINLLKCFKTTFYIYTITLLLISSIMIVMQLASQKI